MRDNTAFAVGMIVVCQDDENVEAMIQKNKVYTVNDVSHRGALLKLAGVPACLASSRFVPVTSTPPAPPMESIKNENF